MLGVKNKAVSVHGNREVKKEALHTDQGKKRTRPGKRVIKRAPVEPKGDIEGIPANFGTDLKNEILKILPRKGRHVIKVVITGGTIQIESPKIAKEAAKALPGKVPAPAFDPQEAGRKVVLQLQQAEGGAWTGAELKEQFGLTPANLHKRRTEHRIVSWTDAKSQFHYPKWQFNPAGALLPGVQEVLQTFRSSDEWRVMRYFLAPRHQLNDRAPLDLLRAGEVDKVLAHAKVHGEENSW